MHDLEHGYVVIYYRDLSQNELSRLTSLVQSDRRKVILNPYPHNPARVVLTAWTRMQQCSGVSEQTIQDFIAAYREH